jgi:tRNA threonylcarbamoyl adenosine modification protein (Sua5/YciO/YrdC/YwlC family)
MLEYVYPNNIDHRVLNRCGHIFENGGLVAYPTTTSWGIGCPISSRKGIEKIKKLKGDFLNYTLTILCSTIAQASEISFLSNNSFQVIKRLAPGPYAFIVPSRKVVEKKAKIKCRDIAVRIPSHPVPVALLNHIEEPIFSITASRTMNNTEWWDYAWASENLFESGWELEDIPGVEMVIDTGEPLARVLCTVIDLQEDEAVLIREGAGPV